MTGDVVSIGKLTDERVAELADKGVNLQERVSVEEMNLPEPQYGEVFAAVAEQDEQDLYNELNEVSQKLERWGRELLANVVTDMGQRVRESDINRPIFETFTEGANQPKFDNPEQAEEFARLGQRRAFLHSLLHWKLGERLGLHNWRLGFRKPAPGEDKLRIVKIAERMPS